MAHLNFSSECRALLPESTTISWGSDKSQRAGVITTFWVFSTNTGEKSLYEASREARRSSILRTKCCTTRQFLDGHSSTPQQSFVWTAKIRCFGDILPHRVTVKRCKNCVIFSLLCYAVMVKFSILTPAKTGYHFYVGRPSKQLMRLDAVLQQCARAH